ncbi:hypothetical protein [Anaerobacillus sp. 1_MG-2023]|uniref:hypothetical protein n=1 Tax=Bacillales TaxID=1385 RepID=UPI0026E1D19D|nr:hypothetical protein [Anaerobacillus sp. 1_MG-2023]MDO6657819.1 hypothetical protein [Anaerobacillus sp. 1_MG-2023]
MNRNKTVWIFLLTAMTFMIIFSFVLWSKVNSQASPITVPSDDLQADGFVTAEQFGANGEDANDDSEAIQRAIDYSAEVGIGKVRLTGNNTYYLAQGLIIKEKVELKMDQNTRIFIEGNFRAFELKRNASLSNGTIEVTSPKFRSEVIYLDGQEQNWSTERTRVNNVTIFNSSGSHLGTAMFFFAGKPGDYISFVNVSDVNIIGFYQGIKMEASQSGANNQYTWINGNRFINITLDDCVRCIELIGEVSVPNETSGNQFSELQIQISKVTEKAIILSGSSNQINGMIWDAHLALQESLIEFTPQSYGNNVNLNLLDDRVINNGRSNIYNGGP